MVQLLVDAGADKDIQNKVNCHYRDSESKDMAQTCTSEQLN